MEFHAEVVAKVENNSQKPYMLHTRISTVSDLDEGSALAAFNVTEEEFKSKQIGDRIRFVEDSTVTEIPLDTLKDFDGNNIVSIKGDTNA